MAMDREGVILTPEEEARNRSDTLLLLSSLRRLPRESKLYLAGVADGLSRSCFPTSAQTAPARQ